MLVTDPKARATMQEVLSHAWMTKGYPGPPENYLPPREPLALPLDPEVINAMTGFNFGSPEKISAQLSQTIESEEYQRAVRLYQRERELPQPTKDVEKRRGFGFDFYRRRNSGNSRDTLSAPSSEGLQLGNDPLNAFSPLISIYYLVREKQDRGRAELHPGPGQPSSHREREKGREREREKEKDRDRDKERGKDREKESVPDIAPPQEAHTNTATYEMPGERATGGRSRPRARTHGEDDAPDAGRKGPLSPVTPLSPDGRLEIPAKKEGTAAGLLRRFSTRRRKEPEHLDKDKDKDKVRSHPPVVQVHSPSLAESPATPRKSFSIRRSRKDRDEAVGSRLRSGSSQPQHGDLLSPTLSADAGGSAGQIRRRGLGRSTSVNSAEMRRRVSNRISKDPPMTSGSDQSTPMDRSHGEHGAYGASHQTRSASLRAKSLGHARRESIQQRRLRREEAREANVPEETDQEVGDHSGVSTERLHRSDLAKPVFLKGLFSVSTTSPKSVPEIRAEIKRVLKQLGVDYIEIRGGFSCRHSPSIDLKKVMDTPTSPAAQTPGHKRRFSLGGFMGGDRERDEIRDLDRVPPTPRTPGKAAAILDTSYSNSDISEESVPRENGASSRRAVGETSTHVQSDLGGNMVLDFEIFIVKVPLLSLHGIQFKRMAGNTWQYKNMADQILRELRL
jgi:serine/threonine protein kinase KIN1/2